MKKSKSAHIKQKATGNNIMNSNASSMPDSVEPVDQTPEQIISELHLRQIDLEVRQIELEIQNEHLRNMQIKYEESSNHYNDLFDNAPVGYLTLNDKGLITEINLTAAEMFGLARQDLLSRHFTTLLTAKDSDRWYLFYRKKLDNTQREKIILSLKDCNNVDFLVQLDCLYVNSMLRITLTEISTPRRLEPAATDDLLLAELDQMEIAQHAAQTRLHNIARSLPEVVFQYCLRPDGNACFPYISDAAYNILRLSPDELRDNADRLFYLVHPTDHAGYCKSLEQSAQNLTPWDHEYRVKFDDGTTHWLLANALPQREEDGSTLWHGFFTDITPHKQLKDRLRCDNLALNVISQGVLITDADHNIIWANNAFELITGYNKTEILGQNCRFLQGPFTDQQTLNQIRLALANLTPFSGELINLRKDTTTFWNELTITPLFDEQGQITNFISTLRDITGRKQLEKQLKVSHTFTLDIIKSLNSSLL